MCWFPKRKKNKNKCSEHLAAEQVPNGHCSTKNTVDARGGASGNKKHTIGSKERASRPKVGDVHKKIMTIEENHQVSAKQMEEAMKILGCATVNTTIIQRLEKEGNERGKTEMGEKSQIVSARTSDIQFTLGRKPNKKDDDTMYPLNKQDPNNANKNQEGEDIEIESLQEEWNEEPNSENYMWNTREIRYTCVDMIRHLDKSVLIKATGEGDEFVDQRIEWDPFAPLNVLESRPIFDCQTLRKNTFLSTALCCSTKSEQKAVKTKPKTSVPKKVVKMNEQAKELTKLRAEYSVRTMATQNSDTTLKSKK